MRRIILTKQNSKIYQYISDSILSSYKKNKRLNILITGGQSAKKLYRFWSKNNFLKKIYANLFITDERINPKKESDLNANMIESELLKEKGLINIRFYPLYKKNYERTYY